MAQSVRLDDEFVNTSKVQAVAANRSLPKQIEYVGQIGQMVIDNPELSFAFIQEALLAKAELDTGLVRPYKRKTHRGD